MSPVKNSTLLIVLLTLLLTVAGCSPVLILPTSESTFTDETLDAFDFNNNLGRGINLGNALEAPTEGEWGLILEEAYFEEIAAAGFDSIRVPIRWSAHTAMEPPYTIDESFFERVDWVIEQAIANDLVTIINIHHYDELIASPQTDRERFLAIWRQIAERYAGAPNTLYFELLNEPNGRLYTELWNDLLLEGLAAVRSSNPDRAVVIGPAKWNNIDLLSTLSLPEDDTDLIATFHYYDPFQFTHQGAEWVGGSDPWLGNTWTGLAVEKEAIERDFTRAANWSEKSGRPIYMGEFGAYSKADIDSRAAWTSAVVEAAEKHGFSWGYWEFGAGFGAYDREEQAWNEPLLDALMPE